MNDLAFTTVGISLLLFVVIVTFTLLLEQGDGCYEEMAASYCLKHNSSVVVAATNGVKCTALPYKQPEVHFWNETEIQLCR